LSKNFGNFCDSSFYGLEIYQEFWKTLEFFF